MQSQEVTRSKTYTMNERQGQEMRGSMIRDIQMSALWQEQQG